MSFPYTQRAGAQDYEAFGHLGFRYLEIPGADEEITVDDVSATMVHAAYPEDGGATFASSDPTLDAVWDPMVRSLRYSVMETFVDTPTREQGQFLHDTVNISYGLMATEHDRVATRQAIREFMLSQERAEPGHELADAELGHHRTLLIKQPLPDPACGVPLLARCGQVSDQPPTDRCLVRAEHRRGPRRRLPHRRHRIG